MSASLAPASGTCPASCVLFNNTGPLWSALANPDSTNIPVAIAAIRYAPVPGDSLTLQLRADSTVLNGINPDEIVDVSDGIVDARVALRNLTMATTGWRFASADTTTLQVTLNRALAAGLNGHVVLIASSAAAVVAVARPWFASVDSSASSQPSATRGAVAGLGRMHADVTPGCASQGVPIFQDGTYCGVNVHFFRAVPADAFLAAGATFQSDQGHGVSHEIIITFSQPVASVTVTAYDPTFAGNQMSALDSTGGLIGTVPFPGNNMPGTLTTQTGTLSGAIASVHLIPAPLDYVAYSMRVTFRSQASGIKLLLVPATTGLLTPSWKAFRNDVCTIPPIPQQRGYQVRVTPVNPANPDSVNGRSIMLTLSAVRFSGSHIHDNVERPTGSFVSGAQVSDMTVVTGSSGVANFRFVAPEPSGQYVVTASADGAPTTADTVTVGYALTHLPTYVNYMFTGEKPIHPDAHYASAQTAVSLRVLADSVVAHGLPVLGINDESLSLGGLFDLNADWAPPQHCSHRDGVAADIQNKFLTGAQKRWLREVWARIDGAAGSVPEGNHLHLKILR